MTHPSSATGAHYTQISALFGQTAHATLNGYGTARENLARLDDRLRTLQLRAALVAQPARAKAWPSLSNR